MVRFLVFTFSTLLLLLIIGIVAIGGVFWYYGQSLPDYRALADYEPPITTRLYAGDGRLMTEYAVEKRVFVPIDAIPQKVIAAFLAAEDKSFYTHSGIDPMGLARAVLTNVRNMGSNRRPVGASTITQQVAKNFLLTNEVSIDRKVKEAILAMRIEQTYTKDKILELYLNEIYLGYGSYGVAAAALNYFNKSLDQLTVAEAAYLAALPKAPNNYHPVRKHEAAVERRNWVVSRMLEDGHISAEQAREAVAQPLETHSRDETEYVKGGDYFAEEVRRQLISEYGEAELYKGGLVVRTTLDPHLQHLATQSLQRGLLDYDRRHGWRAPVDHADLPADSAKALWLKVLTAVPRPKGALDRWDLAIVLDASGADAKIGLSDGSTATIPLSELKWARPWKEKQRLGPAVRSASDVLNLGDVILVEPMPAAEIDKKDANKGPIYYLRQVPNVNGGMVAMDPHTGRVLAMAGGWSIEASEFNRATQALRQPGSSFKPFVYLAALENGYTPSTLVLDAPFVYDQGPGLPKWRPKNYSGQYYGPSTLRIGIEKSRNLMTVRLAQAVGMERVAAKAETFGIDEHFPKMLAASLGAGETTVLRMTTAYGMLANGGKRLVPTLIDRIQDRNGRTIYRHDTRSCDACADVFWTDQPMPDIPDTREQISDPRSVYQIVHIMEGVITAGTGRRLASLGVPMAGKTGTTNDNYDTWFMGFTPDLVVGVFVGFDEPRTLGGHETGSSTALPVFQTFMEQALKGQAVRPFPVPPGIQFMRINHDTGAFAQPGDSDVIREAFKTGSGPGYVTQMVLDGSAPLDPNTTLEDPAGAPEMLIEEGASTDGVPVADSDSASQPVAPPYQSGQPNPYGNPVYPLNGPNDNRAAQPTAGGLY
jgi:penicillin-binding protein 1A